LGLTPVGGVRAWLDAASRIALTSVRSREFGARGRRIGVVGKVLAHLCIREAAAGDLARALTQIAGSRFHSNVLLSDDVAIVVPSGLNDGETAARPARGSPTVWRVATSTSRIVETAADLKSPAASGLPSGRRQD
jgi:hypothetical protein